MPPDITHLLVLAQGYPEVVPWDWVHPVGPGCYFLLVLLFIASLVGVGGGLFLIFRAAILKSITKTDKQVRIILGSFVLLCSICLPFVTLFLLDHFGR